MYCPGQPTNGKKWVAKLRQRARSAADTALAGRIVPEFNQNDIREVFLGNYRIVYRVRDDGILVLTVFEGHQLLKL
ncbi:type II toxin-antitoxin system RelE/ParE family toxin [Methyloglobulus sp.]|uniref:type II toxin-antitoxin system RelE/ParE family toxin n=1 Tax=Methyloglobulus sp. TaxID=2518622 RepID=UPI003988D226